MCDKKNQVSDTSIILVSFFFYQYLLYNGQRKQKRSNSEE
jgi:hypothetical protein